MYDCILIPLDGSEAARAAAAFAERIPSRRVVLLRVEPDFQPLGPGPLQDFRPDWREVVAAQARQEMEPAAAPLRARGTEVELAVRFGDPAEQIIAAEADADLVVMTTHGRGAAGRLLYGSTADRVARHGTRPTLLLRGGERPVAPAPTRRLVVPLDGSELAERSLPVAARLAKELGVPVQLVRVVDLDEVLATIRLRRRALAAPAPAEDAYDRARAEREREAERYLAERAGRLAAEGVTAETAVRSGTPAFVLLGLLAPDDVAVITTHGHGGVRRWLLGSVAEKLLREAPAPLLLVRASG